MFATVPKLNGSASTAAVAAATGEPVNVPASDPMVIRLSKPLISHKGAINELRLRPPVARDYADIGSLPFDVRGADADRRVTVDFKLALRWLSALSDHDEVVLAGLAQRDFLDAVTRVNEILVGAGVDKMGN